MTVITAAVVSAHANSLLALIDNAETCTLGVARPATVEMDGVTATFCVADGDALYVLTLQPVPGSAPDGVAFTRREPA